MNKTIPLAGYQYHIDVFSEDVVSGWAFKKVDDAHHPVIELRANGIVLWQVVADQYREDLVDAGFNNGCYGFSIIPSTNEITHSISSVSLYIDDMLIQDNVPFFIEPDDPSVVEVVPARMGSLPSPNRYRFHIDYYDSSTVQGWVYKNNQDDHRVSVDVRCGDVILAFGIATQFRGDLLNEGIGDGAYGFSLTPFLDKFPQAECECHLYADGEKVSSEPFVVSASQEAINHAVYQAQFSNEFTNFSVLVEDALIKLNQDASDLERESLYHDSENSELQAVKQSLAELSVRVKIMEGVLGRHFLN